jgi:hypothetical protein
LEATFTTKQRDINLKSTTEKINLWCFGDIHRFTKSCDEERWKWFLERAKKTHTENSYYFGTGDYADFASYSERKLIQQLHEQTVEDLGEEVIRKNRIFAQEMAFMKPNILGLIEGNHNWKFTNGKTSTEDLAERLMTESLGFLCHYTLKVRFINRGVKAMVMIYIIICHGRAGGKTAGASINQVDDLRNIFPLADIYVFGHDHQRWARPVSVLVPSSDNDGRIFIKQKRQFLSRAGSFKKAYTEGLDGYEVRRLLRPADLGALQFEIGFHREVKTGDRIVVDIKAIV